MLSITATIILDAIAGFGLECGRDHLKNKVVEYGNKLPGHLLEAIQHLEAPVNHHVEKAALAAQWLATKLVAQKLKESFSEKGANFLEPLVQIEQESNAVLKQIQAKNYRLPTDPLHLEEIVMLVTDGFKKNNVDKAALRNKLTNAHLTSLTNRLSKGYRLNRIGYEEFEKTIYSGLQVYGENTKQTDWFELTCIFFNELLKGDNNKSKDGYQNQLLAQLSADNQELKEMLGEAIRQFEQIFIPERITIDKVNELQTTIKNEVHSILIPLDRVEASIARLQTAVDKLHVEPRTHYDVLIETAKYLKKIILLNKEIDLPAIKEKERLPKIPLEKVYVALKVHQKANKYERSRALKFFTKKREEKIKQLGRNPTFDELYEIEAELFQQYPVMRSLEDNRTNVLLFDQADNVGLRTSEKVVTLAEAFQKERYLVILGDPGSGKSTLSKWLTLKLAQAMLEEVEEGTPQLVEVPINQVDTTLTSEGRLENLGPARLPLFIRMSEYAVIYNREGTELLTYFIYYVNKLIGKEKEAEQGKEIVESYLRDGKAVIILDGMDEIIFNRSEIIKKIEVFLAEWVEEYTDTETNGSSTLFRPPVEIGGNQVIITSRIVGYQSAPLNGEITHVTIEKMEEQAVRHFCDVWTRQVHLLENKGTLPDEDVIKLATEESEALQRAIFDPLKPRIKELATNPLLVTILALIFRHDTDPTSGEQQLPSQRAELYERALNILVEKWREGISISAEEIKYILAPVANYIHSSEKDGITHDQLTKIITDELAHYRNLKNTEAAFSLTDEIQAFVRKIRDDVGLLAERAPGLYHFLHRTFQEYLAGIYLVRDPRCSSNNIISKIEDPIWREPILLALGYIDIIERTRTNTEQREIDYLVGAMLKADDPLKDLIPRSALFVAMAIPEMDHLNDQLFEEIINQLLETYHQNREKAEFKSINTQIEQLLTKLYEGNKGASLEKVFFTILQTTPSQALVSVVTHLIWEKKWFKPDYEPLFQQLIYQDSPAYNFPIDAVLRRYRSIYQNEDSFVDINLRFRKRLSDSKELTDQINNSLQWQRLIIGLYGGLPDTGIGEDWLSFEHLKLKLNQKVGSSDEQYNLAVRLDTEYGRVSSIKQFPPEFQPKYIYRESIFTRKILELLRDEEEPMNLDDYFLNFYEQAHNDTQKVEALLGLILIGVDVRNIINNKDQKQSISSELVQLLFNQIRRIENSLNDSIIRQFAYFNKNTSAFSSFFDQIPIEKRYGILSILTEVFNSLNLPPVYIAYTLDDKRVFDVLSEHEKELIEAEGWGYRLSLYSDDPVYSNAVLLDTVAQLLKTPLSILEGAISKLDLTKNIKGVFFAKRATSFLPLMPISAEERLEFALDNLSLISDEFDFVKDWIIWSLKPSLDLYPPIYLQATVLAVFLKTNSRSRSLNSSVFETNDPHVELAKYVNEMDDAYYKCKLQIKLFEETKKITYLNDAFLLVLVDSIQQPERIVQAIELLLPHISNTDDSIVMVFRFVGEKKDRFINYYEVLYLKASLAVAEITNVCRRLRLACRLAMLHPERVDEQLILETIRNSFIKNSMTLEEETEFSQTLREIKTIFPDNKAIRESIHQLNFQISEHSNIAKGFVHKNLFTLDTYIQNDKSFWSALTLLVQCRESSSLFVTDELPNLIATPPDSLSYKTIHNLSISQSDSSSRLTKATIDEIQQIQLQHKDQRLGQFLSVLENPDINVQPYLQEWLHSDNPLIKNCYYLIEAEQGRISLQGLYSLVDLLTTDNDRLRLRSAVVIHGFNPSSNKIDRAWSASQLGHELLKEIFKIADTAQEPYVATRLSWFQNNFYLDSLEVLNQLVYAVEQNGRDKKYYLKVISQIERVNSRLVFNRLIELINHKDVQVRKAIIKLLCRLSYTQKLPTNYYVQLLTALHSDQISLLNSIKIYGFNVNSIFESLENSIDSTLSIHKQISRAEVGLSQVSRVDLTTVLSQDADHLKSTFTRAGSTFYVSQETLLREATEVAGKVQNSSPKYLELLVHWTLQRLSEELTDTDLPMLGDLLCLLLSGCAANQPDQFASIVEEIPGAEALLIEALKSYRSWVGRRGAIMLLSFFREPSPSVLDALALALKDIDFVAKGVQTSWKYFNGIANKKIINKLITFLASSSGTLASTAVEILSEVARSKECESETRKKIIESMANAIRHQQKGNTTFIYSLEDHDNHYIHTRGTVEKILFEELIKVSGLA
ncbi:hypothetical protein LC612_30330 [Nostoc sp. CHAB 5834]|nr:hypothetical protein [Nostoc sp. CHAB 5834]